MTLRQELITKMTKRLRDRFETWWTEGDKLLAYSGGLINWVGDCLTDENIIWTKEKILIDQLRLTGTHPEFNEIIIDRCQRDPKKFRELLGSDPAVQAVFADIEYDMTGPILIRHDKEGFSVLDGMYEVIAAIRDGQTELEVYVATPQEGVPRPHCEPHVVYDIIRPYHRGYNRDITGLIAALKFIKDSYGNGEALIRERFNEQWVLEDKEFHQAVKQVLES